MNYPKLISGKLLKRYKRFLCDIELSSGEVVVAHCVNTGSMRTCCEEGSTVFLSLSQNPKRKLKYTLEIIKQGKTFIGVNTLLANKLVKEAILNGHIPELKGYDQLKTEVKYGENSRVDILLQSEKTTCYVEIKNVSMVYKNIAYFPDAVTKRGTKHLRELATIAKVHRAVIFFLVQRDDCDKFQPAVFIDPEYAQTLNKSWESGVEILVYQSKINHKKNVVRQKLPWTLNDEI